MAPPASDNTSFPRAPRARLRSSRAGFGKVPVPGSIAFPRAPGARCWPPEPNLVDPGPRSGVGKVGCHDHSRGAVPSRIVGSRDAGGRHIVSVKNTPQHSVSYGRRIGTGNVCVAMKTEEFERKRGSLPTMPHTLRVDVQFLG